MRDFIRHCILQTSCLYLRSKVSSFFSLTHTCTLTRGPLVPGCPGFPGGPGIPYQTQERIYESLHRCANRAARPCLKTKHSKEETGSHLKEFPFSDNELQTYRRPVDPVSHCVCVCVYYVRVLCAFMKRSLWSFSVA